MKRLSALLLVTMLVFGFSSIAKADDEYIAVVDIQLVLQDSSAAKDIREQIKQKRDEYQKQITAEEDKLRKEEQALSEQRSILSADAFNEKRDAFKEKLIKVQRDVQEKRSTLDDLLTASLAQVQQVVFDIIHDLAEEKGFKIAIPTSQILYAEEKLNITADVLKILDKKLPKVDINSANIEKKEDGKKN